MTEVTKSRLERIFDKHGTDKGALGYGQVYEDMFVGRDVLSLLEVGIGTLVPGANSSMAEYNGYKPGASLRAWAEYFSKADIWGLDIQPDACEAIDDDRISVIHCDSTSTSDVDKAIRGMSFDVIIDDGSHHSHDQIATLKNLWPNLKPDGLYVIEDIVFPLDAHDVEEVIGLGEWRYRFLTPKMVTMLVIHK